MLFKLDFGEEKETFETSAVSSSASGPAWALDPTGRTGLKMGTYYLRLKLERRKESSRAKENSQIFAKMSQLIFRKIWLFSAVRHAHRRASFAGCP